MTMRNTAAGLASEYDYVLTLRIEIPCPARAGLQGASIKKANCHFSDNGLFI